MGSAYVPVEIGCSVGKSTQIALPSGHLIADQLCVPLLLQQPWKAPHIFLSGWFSWKHRKEICSSFRHLHRSIVVGFFFFLFLSLRNKRTLKINPDLREEKFFGGLTGKESFTFISPLVSSAVGFPWATGWFSKENRVFQGGGETDTFRGCWWNVIW